MDEAFRHQQACDAPPRAPFDLHAPPPDPPIDGAEFRDRMRAVGDALRRAGVSQVLLVHGTFAGEDVLGLGSAIEPYLPGVARALGRGSKFVVDAVMREHGNYTRRYAAAFESALNGADATPAIPVRLWNWSGENHHLGRADAAVKLIDELDRIAEASPSSRVLLWGHSHGGNVFALATQLLNANEAARERFFEAARVHVRHPWWGRVDRPIWERVRSRLAESPPLTERLALDFVTFGTPPRYAWPTAGADRLLHFVHHRSRPDVRSDRTVFPPGPLEFFRATDGDYVHQIGIAGSNLMPCPLFWRAWLADRRLSRLLQPGLSWTCWWRRMRRGMRVAEQGTTLLVDYGSTATFNPRRMFGHGIYTEPERLLFHAEEVARRFYGHDRER